MELSCHHKQVHCICETLEGIAEAQSSVKDECQIHCQDFNSPLRIKSNFNTIPIMLICKDQCNFFIGSGIFKSDNSKAFECFKTPVFRVAKVIKVDEQCCVNLELLQPRCKNGFIPSMCDDQDVCSFFPDKKIESFVRTGICIEVDVSCFCGIECLQAVEAHRGKPISPNHPKHSKIIQEEICGNFGSGTQIVWEAESGIFLEGTFQIYNSAQSTAPVEGFVVAKQHVTFPTVQPGFTISRSTIEPTSFTIEAPKGTSGTYCIILTKLIQLNNHINDCD